jgi:sterol desaturase/sphingolipid hydroxylase (fatty acid hydroxylase superfamily)
MPYEPQLRLGFFFGVLVLMALWEAVAPRRVLTSSKPVRWLSNLALVVLNSVLVRLVFVLGAVGIALEAQAHGWGLFNMLEVPSWLAVALSVLALDLAIYGQHVLFHAVPLLWRLHLVHHADRDIDVTTGLRFHTLEILLSMGIKAAAIVLLGAPPLGVLIFEVLLNATSMFNHSNVAMPLGLDRILRMVVVTPDMHRVHHSTIRRETNSNYGFNLPWWDYLFGTYRAQPARGHERMQIGLAEYQDERPLWLPWILLLPFLGPRHAGAKDEDIGEQDADRPAPEALDARDSLRRRR